MPNPKIFAFILLCILASSDARKKKNRGTGTGTLSVTVQGTVLMNIPRNTPKPDYLVVTIKVNNQEPTFETRIHWSQCSSGKCQYVVRHVNGNVGQRFAVGMSLYYDAFGENAASPTRMAWSKEIGELKAEGTTQHIKYDADGQYPRVALIDSLENQTYGSLPGSPRSVYQSSRRNKTVENTNTRGTKSVAGTVHLDLPWGKSGFAKPDNFVLYLEIIDDEKVYLQLIGSQCPDNKCSYSIPNVSGYVGQKYSIGMSLYYSAFSTNYGKSYKIAWSKEILLKEGRNRQDVKVSWTKEIVLGGNKQDTYDQMTVTPIDSDDNIYYNENLNNLKKRLPGVKWLR